MYLRWVTSYELSQRPRFSGLTFWLLTRGIYLHPFIAVFLFTQLEYDGSVSQYAILTF